MLHMKINQNKFVTSLKRFLPLSLKRLNTYFMKFVIMSTF